MSALESITERVNRNGHPDDPDTPRPLLTLAEFFEGNNVAGSICCNLFPCPEPHQVYEILGEIEQRDDVDVIYVQITAFDDPDWPFSDTVWVVTSAGSDEVASWVPEEISPDEVWDNWIDSQPYESVSIPSGMQPIAIWWD
ncbi:MAG: hypothetical protein QNK34_05550 [Woeseiaceae bacterium]|nr:hypothetical protein [Woeseiaceae bacterium]